MNQYPVKIATAALELLFDLPAAIRRIENLSRKCYSVVFLAITGIIVLLYMASEAAILQTAQDSIGVPGAGVYGLGVTAVYLLLITLCLFVLFAVLRLLRQKLSLRRLIKVMLLVALTGFMLDRTVFFILIALRSAVIVVDIGLISDMSILLLALWQTLYLREVIRTITEKHSEKLLTLSVLTYFALLVLITGP